MGKGNICTHGEFEAVFYVDMDFIDTYYKQSRCECCGQTNGVDEDEEQQTAKQLYDAGISYLDKDSDWTHDADVSRMNWEFMIEAIQEKLSRRFPSFQTCNEWRHRPGHTIVLKNELFEIAVADNEWSAAWMLLERTDIDDAGSNRNLMRQNYTSYLEGLKNALVETWGECYGYGGPWTSGPRYTKENTEVA